MTDFVDWLISQFEDNYEAGVNYALKDTGINPVFIDPDDFKVEKSESNPFGKINSPDDVTPEHIETLIGTFQSQGASEILEGATEDNLKQLVIFFANTAPAATLLELSDGKKICIVPKIRDQDESKEAIFEHLSKISLQGYEAKSIQGTDAQWQKALSKL